MYVKLTRPDNSPIWLNAAFIVTIEPRKPSGSVVVPIGDGLDYDVQESPEAVLQLLDGAPAAAVVPVPAPEALAPKPADVSAEPLVMGADDAVAIVPEKQEAPAAAEEEKQPKKRAAKKTTVRKTRAKKPAPIEVPDETVERLRKMMPGSVKKLSNTLVTQFKVPDADAMVGALVEKGVIALDKDHVRWL